jgi:SAM-dependent methyltransferase
MSRALCQCCGEVELHRLVGFSDVPMSGVFRKSTNESLPCIDLYLDVCTHCGLVRQAAGGGPKAYVEVTRSTSLQFPKYVHDLIAKLRSSGVGLDDLVLEIGANDGLFMTALRDAGFNNLVGVEPSQDLAAAAQAKGHTVVCDYFGPGLVPVLLAAHGPARAVICRHTLEHVPQPDTFVAALAQCLDGGNALALVEVPDGSAIPDLLNVYEFWDEHLFCFSQNNLVRLLQRAGLQVVETVIQPHLETRNLLAWCEKADAIRVPDFNDEDSKCVALWQRLPTRWHAFKAGFSDALAQAPSPVYAIGASHSQTNLINYAGVGKRVDFFIDDDPTKVGLFPPVAETRAAIISTAQFEASAVGGTLVKTGFGYEKWTQKLCAHALACGMTVVDPKDFI